MAATSLFDGYIRVSRVGGRSGESFISPDVQRETIQRWAALRGVTIAAWHTDLDQTGGKLERPGLQAALDRVRTGETGGIAVARVDRFSRAGVADALRVIDEIHELGGQLAAIDFGIDPTTPFGEFGMTILLGLARMQRRQTGEAWDTARERAVARGVHVASRTPTGYIRRDDGLLEPHPEWGPRVAELFRMRAGGSSWSSLARYLEEHGVVSPYGSPRWNSRSTIHIVQNRVYLGEARSGAHVNRDAHPPLIDRATWEEAQTARGAPSARSDTPALLTGLLRCAGCRYLMKPDTMNSRGERLRLYRCRGGHAMGVCEARAAVLERVIAPLVEERFFELAAQIKAESAERSALLEDLEAAAAAADQELAVYRDDQRIADALGSERYVEGLRVRAGRAEAAHRTLAEGRAATGGLPIHFDLQALWPDLDTGERQKLLVSAFDAVIIRSGRTLPITDRAFFFARGEAPADLPRRGKRYPLRPFAWPNDPP